MIEYDHYLTQNRILCNKTNQMSIIDAKSQLIADFNLILSDTQTQSVGFSLLYNRKLFCFSNISRS